MLGFKDAAKGNALLISPPPLVGEGRGRGGSYAITITVHALPLAKICDTTTSIKRSTELTVQILNTLLGDNDTSLSSFYEFSIYRPCAQFLWVLLFALMACDGVAQSAAEKYGDPSLLEAPFVDPILYPKDNRFLGIQGKVVLELTINRKGMVESSRPLMSEANGESITTSDGALTAQGHFERSALHVAHPARYTNSFRKRRLRKITVLFNLPPCTDPPQNSGEVIVQVCAPRPLPPMDCCIRYIPTLDVPDVPDVDFGIPTPTVDVIPTPTLDVVNNPPKEKKKKNSTKP